MQLRAGALLCEIEPRLGGCVAGLWRDGEAVLRSTPAAQLHSARLSGCYPLVPYSNRIADARMLWQGGEHALERNNGSEPHAIHGVAWQRAWSVLRSDAQACTLAYEHQPDAGWPFAFACTQTFRLTPESLEMTLALTSRAPQAVPVGLGWHPYFRKRARSRLAFTARGRWEMGPDKLPTGREASPGLEADCAGMDVDHCFDGWDGVAHLRDEALEVRVESDLSRLVVFTNGTRDFVAIEPVSHVNNAINLHAAGMPADALGLVALQSGDSMHARMRITVEAAR